MIIHEVNETNFKEEINKGELRVQEKFDRWDKLGKVNIPIDEFNARAAYLMRDPTLWAYGTLKDKQNNPLKLYYYQDELINDSHRFIHCTAANQIGKTWAIMVKALHHAIHTNSGSVMLISRSEDQAKSILDEMKWMMRRARIPFEPFEDEVSNRFEYHIKSPDGKGVTPIRVFPPTPAILGFPATLIVKDETGFWEKQTDMDPIEYYQQCVEPRTNTTKNWKHPFLTMGQIVSITNPNGQNGLAWWLHNQNKYHKYVFNWLANPNNTLEEYKEAENTLPPIRFASVYAAKYILASGGFITQEQYNRFKEYNIDLVIPSPCTLFLGADFASEEPKSRNTDWTTIYGVVPIKNEKYPMNPRIQVVYRKEFAPRTPREDIYLEIERIKKLPGVSIGKFAYDKIGVADSVKRDFMNRGTFSGSQIEMLTYSLPNKSEVYLNFQTLFLMNMIEGIHIEKLQEQLLALKVEQPTGSIHIKVHHKTEGVKDDEPDALANACFVARGGNDYLDSSFVQAKSDIPKDADETLKKGIKANQEFEAYLKKNAARSFAYF